MLLNSLLLIFCCFSYCCTSQLLLTPSVAYTIGITDNNLHSFFLAKFKNNLVMTCWSTLIAITVITPKPWGRTFNILREKNLRHRPLASIFVLQTLEGRQRLNLRLTCPPYNPILLHPSHPLGKPHVLRQTGAGWWSLWHPSVGKGRFICIAFWPSLRHRMDLGLENFLTYHKIKSPHSLCHTYHLVWEYLSLLQAQWVFLCST